MLVAHHAYSCALNMVEGQEIFLKMSKFWNDNGPMLLPFFIVVSYIIIGIGFNEYFTSKHLYAV